MRRYFRLNLRTALLTITLIGIVLGSWLQSIRSQRLAVAEIQRAGGHIRYADDKIEDRGIVVRWLHDSLGKDAVCRVTSYQGGTQVTQTCLPHLKRLRGLKRADIYSGLRQDDLELGVALRRELLEALPDCTVIHESDKFQIVPKQWLGNQLSRSDVASCLESSPELCPFIVSSVRKDLGSTGEEYLQEPETRERYRQYLAKKWSECQPLLEPDDEFFEYSFRSLGLSRAGFAVIREGEVVAGIEFHHIRYHLE